MSSKKRAPINFSEAFANAVSQTQRTWSHDRSQTLGGSEVFDCLRLGAFKKRFPHLMDEDAEGFEWGHTERGNTVENKLAVPMLQQIFGEESCLYMGEDQKSFIDGRLSVTPDGLVIDQPRDALAQYGVPDLGTDTNHFAIEIKSFGGNNAAPKKTLTNDGIRYTAKPMHVGQNTVQMGMFRRQTNFKMDWGVVLYFNPVKLSDIRPAIVKYDDSVYLRAKTRSDEVFDTSKELKDYEPEGRATGRCDFCEFKTACAMVEQARFNDQIRPLETIPAAAVKKIKAQTIKVDALRKQYTALEKEKKAAEHELREAVFDLDTKRVREADWNVNIIPMKGRKTLNKALMEEDGIDVEKYMTEGAPFFTMRTKADQLELPVKYDYIRR